MAGAYDKRNWVHTSWLVSSYRTRQHLKQRVGGITVGVFANKYMRVSLVRGDAGALIPNRVSSFCRRMHTLPVCSLSVAQTSLHPANVIKTLLQTKGSFKAILPLTWITLSRGAGAQFLLSLPNGALHFAVLEVGGHVQTHVL